jgi:hypothetical protein
MGRGEILSYLSSQNSRTAELQAKLFLAMANACTHAAFLAANLSSPFTRLLYSHEILSNLSCWCFSLCFAWKPDKLPQNPGLDQYVEYAWEVAISCHFS